ncbi:MAG: hypothetical protein ABIJ56_13985, partial [Pseudomonadota bacterium]
MDAGMVDGAEPAEGGESGTEVDVINDEDQVECSPERTETCNGLDDDCDGFVDEDLGVTTCGTGDCMNTAQNCVDGHPQVCEPKVPDVLTCDAPPASCKTTTEGLDNCGNPCERKGPECRCTGGTETEITISEATYRVHAFTEVGSSTLACETPVTIDYLVIGGGGGGGAGRGEGSNGSGGEGGGGNVGVAGEANTGGGGGANA